MSVRAPAAVLCLAAAAGLVFASVSTLDFVAHLDRQMHDLHCSFVPGMVSSDEGAEGCKATLMSPYSSVFRTSMWGGIPISLPAAAVFAFLLFWGIDLFGRPRGQQRAAANVLLVASLVPVGASVVMGYIAFTELQAACKLCIGIYISSGVLLLAAIWARVAAGEPPDDGGGGSGMVWLVAVAQLGGFVLLPVAAYVVMAPDFSRYIGACGELESMEDPYGVLVPLDDNAAGTPTVEVLDPLCPSCRAFEERLEASGQGQRLHRVALLFPLDQTCNWMVSKSLHPGACTVSEAVLCARRERLSPNAVLEWAFANQDALLAAEKANPGAVAQRVSNEFPALAGCLGSAEVQSDLNKALRWAVSHELPVMTPQLYVGGVKLCDEDTDLGMEWALTRILARQADGSLPVMTPSRETMAKAGAPAKDDSTPRAKEPDPKSSTRSKAPRNAGRKPKTKPEPKKEPEPKAKPEPKKEPEPKAKPEPASKLPSLDDDPEEEEEAT